MLKGYQKRVLRSQAHHLEPVVMVGKQGLSPAVIQKINEELDSHELIKIRLLDYDRSERTLLLMQIEEKTQSICAGKVGHLGIFYRQHSDPQKRVIKFPLKS